MKLKNLNHPGFSGDFFCLSQVTLVVLAQYSWTYERGCVVVCRDITRRFRIYSSLIVFSFMSPAKDPLAWEQDALEKHRKHILKIAGWIVPGHGEMFKNPHRKTDSSKQ